MMILYMKQLWKKIILYLILSYTDVFRIDLHQFCHWVLQSPGYGYCVTGKHVLSLAKIPL